MNDDSLKPIDTIRLSPRDRQRLVEEVQRPGRSISPKLERRRLRVEYYGHVVISLRNPDGGTVRYSVTPRNLSTNGLGFIHGQFVHADRKCEVIIPTLTGEWLLSKAKISRCKHLAKLIHDVSVVFDEPINITDYVSLTPEQTKTQHERPYEGDDEPTAESPAVDATRLSGSIIVADDQANDRQLYAMWLGKLGLSTVQADTEQAIRDELAKQAPSLLLIDQTFAGQPSLPLIKQLRQGGFEAPIIVSCESDSDQTQAEALAAGANAIITKPLDRQSLHQIVEQLLLVSSEKAEPGQPRRLRSQLREDPDMQPLIQAFVAELKGLTAQIHEAIGRKDQDGLVQLCTRIKCGSASYGFSPLTRMAKLALGQMQAGQTSGRTTEALNNLTTLLNCVRAE